jgi:two-component system chemotaxis sensor kinase CheA
MKNQNRIKHPLRYNQIKEKYIRVETSKIDKLFDLVGELITIESMVTHSPDLRGLYLQNFNKSASMLNKITRELQEISMSIRMMPLEGLFNKMKRLVRDVSLKMNKKVNFIVSGQETEMDKNVIDEIADPLVHILRNAIDHGIESVEDRIAKGKRETGNISLSARYEGNEILIIVEDDGAGISRDAIIRKTQEKGILKVAPETLSNKEVFALIFEPGFSTAQTITDISGRGVGMDVVKKNIEKLRGSVDINSVEGKGSKFTLRIPLTLAIMEAMLIRVGGSKFALPILSIRESFRPNPKSITITMDGLEVVKVRQEVFPIMRLHELFSLDSDSKMLDEGILIIIEERERKVCLFADEIVGQQQAVIKGFSDYIGKVPGVTGCMILSDGSIGLILDIESLIDMAEKPSMIISQVS